jgi:uncharacterized protein with PQ loop repeat
MSPMELSQILGFIGSGLIIFAYIPQITHLVKEQCSAGVSSRAFMLWFIASLLLLSHAYTTRDWVFITLNGANAILTGLVLFYANKYQGVCASHRA